MSTPPLNIVTGAFGYTGRYITRRLLEMGEAVRTLTGHPDRPNPFGDKVEALPYSFHEPAELVKGLRPASTLYNTYWIRFPHGGTTFERAVENTLTLFRAAREAGVRRLVHVSITNPSPDSPLPYFRGKAILEEALRESGLSYAVLRPTVIFGREDILINNIAWFLRRFPVFVVPGRGDYDLQPIYVEDLAEVAVAAGHQEADMTLDAVGPEVYPYVELVGLIAETLGRAPRILHLPPSLALVLIKGLNLIVRDIVLTRDEIEGLMAGLLVSQDPPSGATLLSDWLRGNADLLGRRYASELARHYR